MLPFTINMLIRSLLLLSYLTFISAQDRKISSSVNPGCQHPSCASKYTTLVYSRAEGSNDCVHQIWDFTRGIPTVIFAITGVNGTLNVTWDGSEPRTFDFTETPIYSFAMIIDKLYEYNDLNDNGEMDERSSRRVYDLRHLSWTRLEGKLNSSDEAALRVQAYRFKSKDQWRSGIITVKLDLLPFKDYASDLPHLIHTANSTLVDISLLNVTTSSDYNASRLAFGVTLLSTDAKWDSMRLSVRKSLDDEHTPGVFEIIEVKTPESYRRGDGGFVQFRPVGYTTESRGVTTSTNAHVSSFNRTSIPRRSTLEQFYRDYEDDKLLVQDVVVSFGDNGDGYYRQTNFTSWSFTVGYGLPPTENFSMFVIMIISIGLGVPVVLAFSGIIYVVVRRCRRTNQHTRMTD